MIHIQGKFSLRSCRKHTVNIFLIGSFTYPCIFRSPSNLLKLIHKIECIIYEILNRGRMHKLSFQECYNSVYYLILNYEGYHTLTILLQKFEKDLMFLDYMDMKQKLQVLRDVCLYPLNNCRRNLQGNLQGNLEGNLQGIEGFADWFEKMEIVQDLKMKAHEYLKGLNFPTELKCEIEMRVQ